MLQVRQLILVTSHPYLYFCRHMIPTLHFISFINCFGLYFCLLKVISMELPIKGVWHVTCTRLVGLILTHIHIILYNCCIDLL